MQTVCVTVTVCGLAYCSFSISGSIPSLFLPHGTISFVNFYTDDDMHKANAICRLVTLTTIALPRLCHKSSPPPSVCVCVRESIFRRPHFFFQRIQINILIELNVCPTSLREELNEDLFEGLLVHNSIGTLLVIQKERKKRRRELSASSYTHTPHHVNLKD